MISEAYSSCELFYMYILSEKNLISPGKRMNLKMSETVKGYLLPEICALLLLYMKPRLQTHTDSEIV